MKIINEARILDGEAVFKIMDTTGLPLDIINESLREKGLGFNIIQFIQAAIDSKNFTYGTIKVKLLNSYKGDRLEMSQLLDKLASDQGWA